MSGELCFASGVTGQTITARLFQGATQVGSDISPISEVTGKGGYYVGDMPTVGPGFYVVTFLSAGAVVGVGTIAWDGQREITPLEAVLYWSGGGLRAFAGGSRA